MVWNIPGTDDIDIEILKKLRHNARLSYSEIAEEVGISRVAVKNRMIALQEKGVIKGYETIISETGDPSGIKFFMDIVTEPEYYLDIVEKLAMFKCNRQIYAGTGESRIHVIGYASNVANLKTHVDQVFGKLKGVKTLVWHVLAVTYKDTDGGIEFEREKHVIPEDDAGNKSV